MWGYSEYHFSNPWLAPLSSQKHLEEAICQPCGEIVCSLCLSAKHPWVSVYLTVVSGDAASGGLAFPAAVRLLTTVSIYPPRW